MQNSIQRHMAVYLLARTTWGGVQIGTASFTYSIKLYAVPTRVKKVTKGHDIMKLEMLWLIIWFWFESCIFHNDPGTLQDHCVIL